MAVLATTVASSPGPEGSAGGGAGHHLLLSSHGLALRAMRRRHEGAAGHRAQPVATTAASERARPRAAASAITPCSCRRWYMDPIFLRRYPTASGVHLYPQIRETFRSDRPAARLGRQLLHAAWLRRTSRRSWRPPLRARRTWAGRSIPRGLLELLVGLKSAVRAAADLHHRERRHGQRRPAGRPASTMRRARYLGAPPGDALSRAIAAGVDVRGFFTGACSTTTSGTRATTSAWAGASTTDAAAHAQGQRPLVPRLRPPGGRPMSDLRLRIRKSFGPVECCAASTSTSPRASSPSSSQPLGLRQVPLLRMIAGLEDVETARWRSPARVWSTRVAPAERGIAMVFQSYALYPHMTVAQNMGFALKMAGSRAERDAAWAAPRAIRCRSNRCWSATPGTVRRPAPARGDRPRHRAQAVAVFLFDEPLSNLDAALRVQMRIELSRLHRSWARRWSTSPTTVSRR